MRFYKKEYIFKSDKVNNDIKLFCITDMHYTFYSDKKFGLLIDVIGKENPDFIIFTGDLIDSVNSIDHESLEKLYLFFKSITKKYKVIFIKGNHDIKDIYRLNFDINYFFNKLSKLKNFCYLNNKKCEFNNICFYGIEMDDEYYYTFKENVYKKLVDGINSNMVKDNKYNILLFHSPILLFKDEVLKSINKIDNIDLILCGHMHNGLVPSFLDFGKNRFGFLSPGKKVMAVYSRNMKVFNKTKLLVLYPLTFYYKLEKYNLEHIFKPGYTIINIEK